jgi:hypothetical protein
VASFLGSSAIKVFLISGEIAIKNGGPFGWGVAVYDENTNELWRLAMTVLRTLACNLMSLL